MLMIRGALIDRKPNRSQPIIAYDLGPDLLTACANTDPLLALKNYCQDFLKTCSKKLALKRHGQLFLLLTLLHMHLKEVPFQTQNLWEENI